jgi:LuxR family transcriptional regulator, quorum-sensing system regulator SolR
MSNPDGPWRRQGVLLFEDYVEQSRQAKTIAELGQIYAAVVASEGYENSVLTSLRGRRIGRVVWAEIPDGYYDAYMQGRWDRIDPVVACSLRAVRPFSWTDVVEQTTLSAAQMEFMNHCRELKVHSGIVYPFHGPGHQLDIISISRRIHEPANPEISSLLHAVSVQTWSRFLELTNEQTFVNLQSTPLTTRELEVLRRHKDGKSRTEIGEILSISVKTVDFHMCNAMAKLGACNPMSAVVIALQRGLIEL